MIYLKIHMYSSPFCFFFFSFHFIELAFFLAFFKTITIGFKDFHYEIIIYKNSKN